MILSTGWRTDIPAFYGDWLNNRISDGYLLEPNVANPDSYIKISLHPSDVEILTFCSKDYAPFLSSVDTINKKYRAFYWYTITPYENDVELYVPVLDKRIETFIALSKKVGKERIVWRYDPIAFTTKYNLMYHMKAFEYIASKLSGYTERCVFSFVHAYLKTRKNMPEIIEVQDMTKRSLCKSMLDICTKYNMTLQTCGMGTKWNVPGIEKSACTNAPMIEHAFNIKLKEMASPGQRDGCGCLPQKTIGAYLTCKHGCRYCYATNDYDAAVKNSLYHNKYSPVFIGEVPTSYEVTEFKMPKVIDDTYNPNQLTIF